MPFFVISFQAVWIIWINSGRWYKVDKPSLNHISHTFYRIKSGELGRHDVYFLFQTIGLWIRVLWQNSLEEHILTFRGMSRLTRWSSSFSTAFLMPQRDVQFCNKTNQIGNKSTPVKIAKILLIY